jgi:hypothetical protein
METPEPDDRRLPADDAWMKKAADFVSGFFHPGGTSQRGCTAQRQP